MGRQAIDLTGQRFGSLVASRRAGVAEGGQALWFCVCDCGGTSTVLGQSLRRGDAKRCHACIAAGRDPAHLAPIHVEVWCRAIGQTGAFVTARDARSGAFLAHSLWSRRPLTGNGQSYPAVKGVMHALADKGLVPHKETSWSMERWLHKANVAFKVHYITGEPKLEELMAQAKASGTGPTVPEMDTSPRFA